MCAIGPTDFAAKIPGNFVESRVLDDPLGGPKPQNGTEVGVPVYRITQSIEIAPRRIWITNSRAPENDNCPLDPVLPQKQFRFEIVNFEPRSTDVLTIQERWVFHRQTIAVAPDYGVNPLAQFNVSGSRFFVLPMQRLGAIQRTRRLGYRTRP